MEQLDFILAKMDKIESKLDDILVQTTKTNGRVNQLEQTVDVIEGDVFELNKYKDYQKGKAKGIWMVVGGLGTVIGIIIEYYLTKK